MKIMTNKLNHFINNSIYTIFFVWDVKIVILLKSGLAKIKEDKCLAVAWKK